RDDGQLSEWGRETRAYAEAVVVGPDRIGGVLEDVVGHVERVHEVPPGVDVELFHPEPHDEALDGLIREAIEDPPNPNNANERLPDDRNAERFEAFFADDAPVVLYYGKLIRNKGV